MPRCRPGLPNIVSFDACAHGGCAVYHRQDEVRHSFQGIIELPKSFQDGGRDGRRLSYGYRWKFSYANRLLCCPCRTFTGTELRLCGCVRRLVCRILARSGAQNITASRIRGLWSPSCRLQDLRLATMVSNMVNALGRETYAVLT